MVQTLRSAALAALINHLPLRHDGLSPGCGGGPQRPRRVRLVPVPVQAPLITDANRSRSPTGPGPGTRSATASASAATDSWYPYLDTCRGCLPTTGTDDFWGNLGRLMTAPYATCRSGAAANITSDGASLCATETIRTSAAATTTPASTGPAAAVTRDAGGSDNAAATTTTSTGPETETTAPDDSLAARFGREVSGGICVIRPKAGYSEGQRKSRANIVDVDRGAILVSVAFSSSQRKGGE
ncbi:hypothetical protein VTK26DRAFT_7505 [Humicola hyalothermophila]